MNKKKNRKEVRPEIVHALEQVPEMMMFVQPERGKGLFQPLVKLDNTLNYLGRFSLLESDIGRFHVCCNDKSEQHPYHLNWPFYLALHGEKFGENHYLEFFGVRNFKFLEWEEATESFRTLGMGSWELRKDLSKSNHWKRNTFCGVYKKKDFSITLANVDPIRDCHGKVCVPYNSEGILRIAKPIISKYAKKYFPEIKNVFVGGINEAQGYDFKKKINS